jgi:hypothetical protein
VATVWQTAVSCTFVCFCLLSNINMPSALSLAITLPQAFVGAYPALADHSAAAVFEQVSRTTLAAQLNSLIILGEPLLLEQLTPGQLLRAADGGRLAVMDAR